ncbi:uncharacterized protein CG3556-like isoform X2 [Stegodyphus dumicola]|uniref:uncharacterized protein CG3556-like isoform X2 n=1 Tax=Stegodyphus dumicola TaxID=202533 RepID=UPI0015B09B24|nr:uncharacterized protein CG3556-like isoform X2 [Stegodyphus dumicola]
MYCLTLLTYFAFASSGISAVFGLSSNSEHNLANYSPPENICYVEPIGGIEWILHKRRSDFGWKEDTHRAIIALAVNDWKNVPQSDIRQNELQLEIEITRALLRASISTFHANDLALYIHALIAINRNPRDFHGVDLVEKLLKVVENEEQVHPFLILALCNAKAVSSYHLDSIISYTGHEERETSRKIEYKALAVKALACAEDLRLASYLHTRAKEHGIQCLRHFQKEDGHFGNLYTTALSVQALIASNILDGWKKDEAIEYLKSQSTVNVNMVSTYYIQLALNAHRYKFVKDIHPHLVIERAPEKEWYHNFIHYTIRTSKNPDVYFTITINAAPNTSFFDIMKLSQEHDSKFK